MKQYTTVYHTAYGKGYILSIQYRRDNSLCMCYFPKHKQHDFITEKELLSGQGEITLKKVNRPPKNSEMSLEDAISSLFSGMG